MPGGLTIQERVERSRVGQAAISVGIVLVLFAVLVTNLPSTSASRKRLIGTTQPILNVIGLDQNWGVFAPDPRRESLQLRARISYPDGGTEIWEPPDRDPVIGTYSDYRWRKLMENVLGEDGEGLLSRRLAVWVARTQRKRRALPSSVTLLRNAAPNQPPGSAIPDGPYTEVQHSELLITPSMIRGGGP